MYDYECVHMCVGGGGVGSKGMLYCIILITHVEPIIVVDLVSESLGFSYQECIGIMSAGHYQSYSLSQLNFFLEFV